MPRAEKIKLKALSTDLKNLKNQYPEDFSIIKHSPDSSHQCSMYMYNYAVVAMRPCTYVCTVYSYMLHT